MIPTILHDKQIWVRALLLACPIEKPLESCPLNDLRKLPLEDTIKLSKTMDEDQLSEISKSIRNL
jgi:hypothetical protein